MGQPCVENPSQSAGSRPFYRLFNSMDSYCWLPVSTCGLDRRAAIQAISTIFSGLGDLTQWPDCVWSLRAGGARPRKGTAADLRTHPRRPFRPAMHRTQAVWGIWVVLADRGSRKSDTSLTKTLSDIQQELSCHPVRKSLI